MGDLCWLSRLCYDICRRDSKTLARLRMLLQTIGVVQVTMDWVSRAKEAAGNKILGERSARLAFDPDHPKTKIKQVVKKFKGSMKYERLHGEVLVLWKLRGARGVQRLKAVCPESAELVSQYAGDTLQRIVRRARSSLTESEALQVVRQLLVAVDDMHQRDKCHNDIKGDHVCVGRAKNGRIRTTLIALGKTTEIYANIIKKPVSHSSAKRQSWRAPEILSGGLCSPASDIYSLGVLLQKLPWKLGLEEWVRRALSVEPELRPSIQEGLDCLDKLLKCPRRHFRNVRTRRNGKRE